MLLLAFMVCCWMLPPMLFAARRRILQQQPPTRFNDTQNHYYDPHLWCSSIQPTSNKENILDQLRKNYTVPLMFWHVQKTGGSSLCGTFVRAYTRTTKHMIRDNYPWSANCNDQEMSTDIIMNPSSYMTKYRPYGKYFVAIEPLYSVNNTWVWVDPNDFPFKYHDQPSTQLLLDTHHASTDAAWNAAVHFIAIRHPLQLAISAFNYKFQPDRDSIFDRCDAFKLTLNECLLAMIQIAEQPVPSPALSSIYQRYQDEQKKVPRDRNTAMYEQEQLQLATISTKRSPSNPSNLQNLLQHLPEDYSSALATADAALRDIANYRGQLMRLVQQTKKGRNREIPRDDFYDYIHIRLSRKRNINTSQINDKQFLSKPKPRPHAKKPLFSVWQEHRIRYQILGNHSYHKPSFHFHHLSIIPSSLLPSVCYH